MIGIKMNNNFSKNGFTLIELIVVMAVFLLVIGGAITIFISIVIHQRHILAVDQLLNQVSYVEEYMSKGLRMAKAEDVENCLVDSEGAHPGYVYLLTRYDSVLQVYRGIKFLNQSDIDSVTNQAVCQEFFLDNTTDPDNPVLKELKNSLDDNKAVALTSAGLKINSVRFSINGSDGSATDCGEHPEKCRAAATDSMQPRATILLNIQIPGDSQNSQRIIQTTVSQRNLNAK